MKVLDTTATLQTILLAHFATAVTPPPSNGAVSACHSQACDDCPNVADINDGYPNCLVYESDSALGDAYASSSGNGYDVWWNSGTPDDTCQIVVRTPASTDLPACGYYLSSWSQAGCYYTSIQDSFMFQYCCGSGDCDAASPASSMADARAQAMMGNTSSVSLKFENLAASGASGKRSIEGVGEVSWKRSDHAYSKRKDIAGDRLQQRADDDCVFHPTSDLTTEGGQQVRASDTQICNTPGGCSLTASTTVTEGESINPSITGNFFDIISAAVGYTFTSSTAYGISTTYTQTQGTTGYMSYIPTMNCWDGTFSGCFQNINGNIVMIDPTESFHACTPSLRSGGDIDGTFSFVYSN